MPKPWLTYAIAGVAVLVGAWLTGSFDRPASAEAFIPVLLVFVPVFAMRNERSSAFIVAHPRGLRVGGAVVIVAAVLMLGGSALTAPSADMQVVVDIGIGLLLVGVFMLWLPSATRRMRGSVSAVENLRSPTPASLGTRVPGDWGVMRGLDASASAVRDWPVFAQIAGPWIVVLTLAFGAIVALNSHDKLSVAQATSALWVILASILLLLLSVPSIAVAWHRWLLEGRRPSTFVALPDRAVLGYLWRLWLFFSILGTAQSTVGPRLAGLVAAPGSKLSAAVGDALGVAIPLVAILLASSFALKLPAIAIGDKTFPRVAVYIGRRLWPVLPIGLAVSLAPSVILSWAAEALTSANPFWKGGTPRLAIVAFEVIMMFAATTAAAAQLSRMYQKAKASLEADG